MSKYIESQINVLSQDLEALSHDMKKDMDFQVFAERRSIINLRIISMLSGAKMGTGLDDPKMKFSGMKPLPDMMELAKICEMLSDYIMTHETPYRLELLGDNTESEDFDDLEIPDDSPRYSVLSKLNSKTFKEFVLGPDENNIGAAANYLTAEDVIRIAGFGEGLRKKKIRNAMFIIGGITVAVIGGVVITSIVRKKKAESDENTIDGVEIPEIDMEADNNDIPIVIDDDVPVVTID